MNTKRRPYNREILAQHLGCDETELRSVLNAATDSVFSRDGTNWIVYRATRDPYKGKVIIREWETGENLPFHQQEDTVNAYGRLVYVGTISPGHIGQNELTEQGELNVYMAPQQD